MFQTNFFRLLLFTAMTAADKYFLKAKDSYPYEIDDALEALEYGLSYDDNHAGLLTLRGQIQYKDLCQYDLAAESFGLAIYHAPDYNEAYYHYIDLLTDTGDIIAAEQLIARALNVKGINKARIWHREALLYERQEMFTIALASLKNARLWTNDKDYSDRYAEEHKRIKKKMKMAGNKEQVAASNGASCPEPIAVSV